MAKFDIATAARIDPLTVDDTRSVNDFLDTVEFFVGELPTPEAKEKLIKFVCKTKIKDICKTKMGDVSAIETFNSLNCLREC